MTDEKNDPGFVFISYARADKAGIEWILINLAAAGYNFFIDKEMSIGSRWESILKQKIFECACILVIWTKHSISSGWVAREVQEAVRCGKKIIPVRLEDVQPTSDFGKFNIADLSKWLGNSDFPAWKKTLDALSRCIDPALLSKGALIPVIKSRYIDAVSVVEHQIIDSNLPISDTHEVVIRTFSRAEFHSQINEISRRAYKLIHIETQVAIYEKSVRFNWPLAFLLSVLLVFPVLVYLKIYKRSAKTERIRLLLIEGLSKQVF